MNDITQVNPVASVNPLLERARMPGETYTLPSKGLLYTNGELSEDVTDGEIQIFPMTAIEEIILRSPDKLFNGSAITDIFRKCVPQIQKPLEIFAKDVDFILVALRKVSYGAEFEIGFTHDCPNAKDHSYMVQIDQFLTASRMIDPTTMGATFTIKLENGQEVSLVPLRYSNVVKALQMIQQLESTGSIPTSEQAQESQIDTLLSVISNVDGINDKVMIKEWLLTVKAGMTQKIQDAIQNINNFGPVFSSTVKCRDCGVEIDVATPLNPMSFFTPS